MMQARALPSAWAGDAGWPRQLRALAGLWLAILLLYWRDAADMVAIWWTSSTYGHCLFLPPIIGWLVWQRREGLGRITPRFWAPGLVWMALGAAFWLLGDAGSLGVIRHGALILLLQGAVAATLGPAVVRGLLFPLFYAFFMVPVGSELEPALQLLTARIAVALLHLFQVPAHLEGIFITIPTGYFKVAEACSGAKFLVAMTAYGVLVCNVCFRSWTRRALFLGGALLACLLANGVRAFGTIYVAHLTTIDAAVGFDHVVYGWLFFALVMAGVMAVAWPFFDRRPGDQAIDGEALAAIPARAVPPMPVAPAAALALNLAPPVWSRISTHWGSADLAPPLLPQVAGWHRVATPMRAPWQPRFDGADHRVMARYADGQGHVVDLAIASFGWQQEGRELVGFGQGAADPEGDWSWTSPAWAPVGARGEAIAAPGPVLRHVVTFYRVGGGAVTGSEATVKLETMKARLLGRDQRAVAILISAEEGEGAPADAAIRAFLAALGDPVRLAEAAAPPR
ncbi:exosortase A [Sphingobium jiangsuense]|nr:exosortase A [Sphingobium jiangsuense]